MAAQPTQPQHTNDENERTAQLAIEAHLNSVTSIPWEHCPWPAVRNTLSERILSGAPIYVYASYTADGVAHWLICDNTYGNYATSTLRQWAIENGYNVGDTSNGKESA